MPLFKSVNTPPKRKNEINKKKYRVLDDVGDKGVLLSQGLRLIIESLESVTKSVSG